MDNNYSIDVSIILVNYNTTDLLVQAIKSIYKYSSELIFVFRSVEQPKTTRNTQA